MTVIESAVQWAIQTANDNSHGYSQVNRWGNPDYDCSSFVITAYRQAGLSLSGATYTGNMRSAFLADGFVDVTMQCGLSSGYGVQAGDVLLNYSAHTCIAIGDGKVANCRTDEGHPQGGDQSGNEIRIQNYWNFPWNCILRYKGKEQAQSNELKPVTGNVSTEKADFLGLESHNWKPQTLKYGAKGTDVFLLQSALVVKKFYANNDRKEIDGEFGAKTQAAVNSAKRFYGQMANGECDLKLWRRLLETG